MAEVHAELLGNPTGSHPPAQRARRLLEDARDEVAAFLGRDPGDDRLHLRRDRVGQPGRPRHDRRRAGANTGRRSCCRRPSSTRRCASRAGPRRVAAPTRRELPVDRAGVLDLDALAPHALVARRRWWRIMTANNETGVVQPVRARGGRGTPPRPACRCLHRRGAGGHLPRPGRADGGGRSGLAERTQGGRARRRRRAGGRCRRGTLAAPARRRPGARAAQRDPGRGGSGRTGHRTAPHGGRARRGDGARSRRCETDWPAACSTRSPEAHRTVPAGVAVLPGHLHLCLPGIEREELLVALGRRRRVRVGWLVVRQRRARAESRDGRHGRLGRPGRREPSASHSARAPPTPRSTGRCPWCPGRRGLAPCAPEQPGGTLVHAGAGGHVGRRRLVRRGRTPGRTGA